MKFAALPLQHKISYNPRAVAARGFKIAYDPFGKFSLRLFFGFYLTFEDKVV